MSIKILWAVILLVLLAISAAVAQTTNSAAPQTRSITIGSFVYRGSATQTSSSSGTIEAVSTYELFLDATDITVNPITFGNAIFLVNGSSVSSKQGGLPIITTGPGCGNPTLQTSCVLLVLGGSEFQLPACASIAANQTLIQNCISVALQLVSTTGKNFSFHLVGGETFCTSGITNIFLLAKQNQAALDPQCDVNNFCKGASAPVVLRALPIKNCN
jgi:hypothetical protein